MPTHTPHPPVPPRAAAPFLAALCLSASLTGCVTERVQRPTDSFGVQSRPGQPRPTGESNSGAITQGPVARPATEASTVRSAVRIAVQPIGMIDFDAQVLPLISPNARNIASQTGEPPDWPTILAQPGASIPRTQIVAHQLPEPDAPDLRPQRINWPQDTRGLLLSRSADTRGVLVESPRADGSRWIGLLAWATGEIDWLVTTQQVNAHAVLVGNTLAWCRRDIADNRWTIVCRDTETGRETTVNASASLVFPIITPDERTLIALALEPERLTAHLHTIDRNNARFRITGSRARIDLGPIGDGLIRAYQATQPAQILQPPSRVTARGAPATNTPAAAEFPGDLALIFHPGLAAMVIIDTTNARLTTLAPRSIAGAWSLNPDGGAPIGAFVAVPEGLVHQHLLTPARARGIRDAAPPSRILSEPFVPRLIIGQPDRQYLLLGPAPRQPNRLTLMGMNIAADTDPSAN
ncbi:MAG: hypothetical protein ACTS3F_14380 [Phycisphaerales bacterium]